MTGAQHDRRQSAVRLGDVADVVRSKNAGIHYLTVDVMFHDPETYQAVKATGVITADTVADRYDIPVASVRVFTIDSALAFKATFPRAHVAGSLADADLYGAQQHAQLLDVEISIEDSGSGA